MEELGKRYHLYVLYLRVNFEKICIHKNEGILLYVVFKTHVLLYLYLHILKLKK